MLNHLINLVQSVGEGECNPQMWRDPQDLRPRGKHRVKGAQHIKFRTFVRSYALSTNQCQTVWNLPFIMVCHRYETGMVQDIKRLADLLGKQSQNSRVWGLILIWFSVQTLYRLCKCWMMLSDSEQYLVEWKGNMFEGHQTVCCMQDVH